MAWAILFPGTWAFPDALVYVWAVVCGLLAAFTAWRDVRARAGLR